MNTEERLDRLEKQNTTLRRGLVGLLLLVVVVPLAAFVWQDRKPKVTKTITARNFVVVDEQGKELGRLGTVNPLLKKKGAVFQSKVGDVECMIDASGVLLTSGKSLVILEAGHLSVSTTTKENVSVSTYVNLSTSTGGASVNIGRNMGGGENLTLLKDDDGARVIVGKHRWPPR